MSAGGPHARDFPAAFVWGAATSATQIEGAAVEGGRGESIWDRFANEPGRIADGSDPRVACDHYHRWRQDLDLAQWMGLNAYRFSISWPRVLPSGRGYVNEQGLDFYDSLVDGMLERGLRPFPTLYHWDLPQALQDEGGWAQRSTAEAFAEYAEIVAARLGDRVKDWTTHNEPWCISVLGHEQGEHAPGHRDPAEALAVAHHVLLSHGWACERIRSMVGAVRVGIVLNLVPSRPATSSAADREAAREFDGAFNRWYLDPLFRGGYPEDAVADRIRRGHSPADGLPFVQENDLHAIASPLDFLGVNYYSRVVVRAGENGEPESVSTVEPAELTDMGWEVHAPSMRALLNRIHRDYRPPAIYVTENGAAYSDGPDESGRIRDEWRLRFLREHIDQARASIEDGVPLRGYFAWSLLDNFEWAHGYRMRFGLIWVDYSTQRRLPKDSAFWYRDFLAGRAALDAADSPASRSVS